MNRMSAAGRGSRTARAARGGAGRDSSHPQRAGRDASGEPLPHFTRPDRPGPSRPRRSTADRKRRTPMSDPYQSAPDNPFQPPSPATAPPTAPLDTPVTGYGSSFGEP